MDLIRKFMPPTGTTFRTRDSVGLGELSPCLCEIASFLQSVEMAGRLVRYDDWYDDWWEHDGAHFVRTEISISELFRIIESARSILTSTPDDDDVFVGIAASDGRWYLRFRGEWAEDGNSIVGRLDITLPDELATSFRKEIVLQLSCEILEEPACEYFRRITV